MQAKRAVRGICMAALFVVLYTGNAWAYTLSYFAEGFDVENYLAENDPTVLVVVFGGDVQLDQVLTPQIDPLAVLGSAIDFHFDLAVYAESSIVFVPHETLIYAVLKDTDFETAFDPAALETFDFVSGAGSRVVSAEDLIIIFTAENTYVKLENIAQTADFQVSFDVNTLEITQAVPAPSVVPEPATCFLVGLGLLGLMGMIRKIKPKGISGRKACFLLLIFTSILAITENMVNAETLTVRGTDVIFWAGYEEVTIPDLTAKDELPPVMLRRFQQVTADNFLKETQPQAIPVNENMGYAFSANGQIHYGLGYAKSTDLEIGPDGTGQIQVSALTFPNSVSGYMGPAGALIGVFLDDSDPWDWEVFPSTTVGFFNKQNEWIETAFWAMYPDGHQMFVEGDHGAIPFYHENFGTSFLEAHPAIGQVFFIGNGLTEDGVEQMFVAPPGATRLYLGVADAWNMYEEIVGYEGIHEDDVTLGTKFPLYPGYYTDNDGEFDVQIEITADIAAEQTFTLKKDGNGSGTVLIGEYECDTTCSQLTIPQTDQTMLVLKAIPEPGSYFVGWSDLQHKVLNKTFQAQAGDTVVATFEQEQSEEPSSENLSFLVVGEWEKQTANQHDRMRIDWNEETQRFEGYLTYVSELTQCIGYKVGELDWIGYLTDEPGVLQEQARTALYLKIGDQCSVMNRSWKEGIVDINAWPSADHGIFERGADYLRLN